MCPSLSSYFVQATISKLVDLRVSKRVKQVITHPNWSRIRDDINYDFSLLELETSIDFSTSLHIRPVSLLLGYLKRIWGSISTNLNIKIVYILWGVTQWPKIAEVISWYFSINTRDKGIGQSLSVFLSVCLSLCMM